MDHRTIHIEHTPEFAFCCSNMCNPKTFTLEVTAGDLVLLETLLQIGLVQVPEHNDALILLLQRVRALRPLPFVAPPTPTSVRAGSASLSPTRFSPDTPGSTSSMLASLGSPLPVVADQTSAEAENLDWEMVGCDLAQGAGDLM